MKRIMMIAAWFLLLLPSSVWALSVDLNKAQFSWTANVVDATHGAPTSYNLKCGTVTGVYTITFSVISTAVMVPVNSVVTIPGTYFCVVTAVDAFGESGASNEVSFQGGFGPSAPSTLTVK